MKVFASLVFSSQTYLFTLRSGAQRQNGGYELDCCFFFVASLSMWDDHLKPCASTLPGLKNYASFHMFSMSLFFWPRYPKASAAAECSHPAAMRAHARSLAACLLAGKRHHFRSFEMRKVEKVERTSCSEEVKKKLSLLFLKCLKGSAYLLFSPETSTPDRKRMLCSVVQKFAEQFGTIKNHSQNVDES